MSVQTRAVAIYRRFLPQGWWLVTLLAGFLRFFNLSYPHSLVFDETFYVKDAWSLIHNGYESAWPTGTDAKWAHGLVNGYDTIGSFVVHPPLGKFLIALPMLLFGAQNSWTWRFSTAVFGTLAVLLLMLVAKKLFGSQSAAVLAGLLLAIDGHAIVMSRTGLLDGILMFFILLAFYCLLLDRAKVRIKYQAMALRGESSVFWARPWLVACAAALGLATSVKWSGLYVAAIFGLYVVVSETLLRRRLGLKDWLADGAIGQSVANFTLMLPVFLGVYVLNWMGWILTNGGWDRHIRASWWQSLYQYHLDIYNFHVNLHTPHSYASNPLTWLFMLRPVSFYWKSTDCNQSVNGCSSAIQAIGNPLIWWGAAAALFYLVYHYLRYRNRTEGLILLGVAATYLPWLLYMGRTVFEFYGIAFLPFTILGLVYTLRSLWYREPVMGRRPWRTAIVWYLLAVALVSVFFLNLWWGFVTPYWFWLSHMWLGNWWI